MIKMHLVATDANGKVTNKLTRAVDRADIPDWIGCQKNNPRARFVKITVDGQTTAHDLGPWTPDRKRTHRPSAHMALAARRESLASMGLPLAWA